MNENLPPSDPAISEQLRRRAVSRPPEDLLGEISAALDGARERGGVTTRPRFRWSAPRLAGAAFGVAITALLVAAVAVPRWNGGAARPGETAGYPAQRALTTAELAAIMAGPALPTNTTLIAYVTIDARTDVCPMNRYPTLGVVEGMASQVCVMSATLADLTSSYAQGAGTFAFRYLGPGYLGLLGPIFPASSSRLAFTVAENWPLNREAFVVEGWLGAEELAESCLSAPAAGDVLNPNGEDCPYDDWVGDRSRAVGITSDHVYYPPSPEPSYDPLSLRGDARHVEAGGMRLIDSVDPATPVFGVYVVRSVTEACAGDPPTSARGCLAWRVLARVPDIEKSPSPQPTPPASAEPPSPTLSIPETPIVPPTTGPSDEPVASNEPIGYIAPGNRALAPDQLRTLFGADAASLAGRFVIEERATCDGIDCTGVAPKPVADLFGPNYVPEYIGPVDVRPDGSLVWTVPQALADFQNHFIFIVDATMYGDTLSTWLDSDASAELTAQDGAFSRFAPAGTPANSAVRGLFLVQVVDNGKTCGLGSPAPSGPCAPQVEIMARLVTTAVP